MQHFVRRRRWLRKRVRLPQGSNSAGLEGELSKLGAEAGDCPVPYLIGALQQMTAYLQSRFVCRAGQLTC